MTDLNKPLSVKQVSLASIPKDIAIGSAFALTHS